MPLLRTPRSRDSGEPKMYSRVQTAGLKDPTHTLPALLKRGPKKLLVVSRLASLSLCHPLSLVDQTPCSQGRTAQGSLAGGCSFRPLECRQTVTKRCSASQMLGVLDSNIVRDSFTPALQPRPSLVTEPIARGTV